MSTEAPSKHLTVAEAATQRRSIRAYTSQPIPEADLREILRLAGLAPSPWNVQPWRVVVVREPELKEKLMGAAFGQKQVGAAPAVLVVYSDMENALGTIDEAIHPGFGDQIGAVRDQLLGHFAPQTQDEREAWGNAISYIFLGYLMLVARSMGYSSSPMLGFDPLAVKSLLGLPENARVPALLSLGVADEEGFAHHRHAVDRFTRWR